jgi:hypothetical protein
VPTALTRVADFLGLTAAQAPEPGLAVGANDIVTPFPSDRSHFYAATFANLFDLDYIPVTRETGMDLGVLAKGRHLICETIGNFGFISMTGATQSPVQPITARQPEIGRARSTSMIWWCDAMYWFGRVWLLAREYDQVSGLPTRFQWVPEWNADVDSQGLLVKAFGKTVSQVDVFRIDGPHEGILNYGKKTIRRVMAVTAAAANAADNPVPSINLHQTGGTAMTDDEIDTMIERWVTARQKKGGGVGYTNQSVTAEAMGIQPEQLLIAAQNYSDMQLVRLAGLPAWAVDITVEGSNLTYSNSPSRARELVDFSLQPYMTAIADRFSMDDISPAGDWYRFDTVQVLRGDLLSRMQAYQIAIATKVYTIEQCQQLEAGVTLEGA